MLSWERSGKTVCSNCTIISYTCHGNPHLKIESRKTKIPHANGVGTWEHTFYHVLVNGYDMKQCVTLKEAKAYAERFGTEVSK